MALFTTTLDLYGGVLWSGELQGFIIHEMVPTNELNINKPCVGKKMTTYAIRAAGNGNNGVFLLNQ